MSSRPPAPLADKYRPLFLLGKGGMGSVEAALEQGHAGLARVVALKKQLPGADARHAEMFLREARVATMLDHPNVVRAYECGTAGDELYLAMEYVEGEPLSTVIEAARGLDPALAAFVVAEVCEGLHAAHELRDAFGQPVHLVHRDVSPHNVMVAYDGRVKLLDFGVAKLDVAQVLTRTGEVKGKSAYMSPEQALGDALDRRSDLYAVGALLFECVAGRRMWAGETDLEVLRRLALEEPPRLDAVVPGAPRALVDLHARLVERDRAARPPSARAVAGELRAFARGVDAAALAAAMTRLFGARIASKQQRLRDALASVPGRAPSVPPEGAPATATAALPATPRADQVTAALADTPGAGGTNDKLALAMAPTLAATPATRLLASPHGASGTAPTGAARLARWIAPIVVGLGAAAVGVFAFRTSTRAPPAAEHVAGEHAMTAASPASPSSPSAAPPVAPSAPPVAPSAVPDAPPVASAAPPASAPRRAAPKSPGGARSARPSPPASAAPPKSPDVDPNPI